MPEWWLDTGLVSVAVGFGLGLLWAVHSTSRRRRMFMRAVMPPRGQLRWFALTFIGVGGYLSFIAAVGLLVRDGLVPGDVALFILALAAVAFCAALGFASLEQPDGRAPAPVLRDPGIEPTPRLRRTA